MRRCANGTAVPELAVRRAALIVAYDGTAYSGLQAQRHDPQTIQQRIEKASAALGCAAPDFEACGRTDSGVHAEGQVVALNVPTRMEDRRIAPAFNRYLPDDIRVLRAVTCADDFSPRHHAIMRTYVYRFTERTEPPPAMRFAVAQLGWELDPDLACAAATAFVGHREMAAWRSSICQAKRTLLTIDDATVFAPDFTGIEPRPYWILRFRARSFLHHQVRLMTGAVIAVGCGRIPLDALVRALAEGTRPALVKMEAACGLTFRSVDFAPGKSPFDAQPTDDVGPGL